MKKKLNLIVVQINFISENVFKNDNKKLSFFVFFYSNRVVRSFHRFKIKTKMERKLLFFDRFLKRLTNLNLPNPTE